jgi:sugar lactone lactonase YvrE
MKRSTLLQTIIIVFIIASFSACSKSGSNPAPKNDDIGKGSTVAITSLSVTTGPYTTGVIIDGKGFSTTATDNHVQFNGKDAVVQLASATELHTSVPLAAGTGKVTVTVGGVKADGPVFTYQVAEVVTNFAGNSNNAGSANGTGSAATFFQPNGLAADGAGNIYVADTHNNLIRKISPEGVVTTLAGSGQSGSTNGTGTAASFNAPTGIAVDATGNVYVADKYSTLIRKITPSGVVTTLAGGGPRQPTDGTGAAASFETPIGIAVDGSGNVFVADQGAGHIRKVTPTGVVTTIYGGPGLDPYYIALDKAGNIYTTDVISNSVKKMTPSGVLSTFAGNGNIIGGDLDGTGKSAGFYRPIGLTIDGDGNLYVIDTGNGEVRKITPAAAVTTIGGGSGDLYGPLTNALIQGAWAITVDGAGNIYFTCGNEIRKVSMQ